MYCSIMLYSYSSSQVFIICGCNVECNSSTPTVLVKCSSFVVEVQNATALLLQFQQSVHHLWLKYRMLQLYSYSSSEVLIICGCSVECNSCTPYSSSQVSVYHLWSQCRVQQLYSYSSSKVFIIKCCGRSAVCNK